MARAAGFSILLTMIPENHHTGVLLWRQILSFCRGYDSRRRRLPPSDAAAGCRRTAGG